MHIGRMVLLMGLLIPALSAQAKDRKPHEVQTSWDVAIAADGTLESLTLVSKLPADLASKLEEEIRRWDFHPGRMNGKPVALQSSLSVRLGVEYQDDSAYVRILSGTTGVRAAKIPPLTFPEFAKRKQRGGLVVITGEYDATGKVIKVEVHQDSQVKSGSLVAAAKSGVQYFQMKPEVVGGKPVAGLFAVPVCFHFGRQGGQDCEWKRPQDAVALQNGQAYGLNPEVRLQTSVEGRML